MATSRARYNTIIVADKLLLKENMSEDVRKYLLKASNNSFVSFAKTISAGSITLTVKDKIDLSKFEKKRAELVNGKENIYIIDTNVFVNCPDVISKIGKKYKIIIPSTVLEELDKLKIKEGIDKLHLAKLLKIFLWHLHNSILVWKMPMFLSYPMGLIGKIPIARFYL